MASGIYISYRRDDTRHAAGRLADDLAPHFGAGNIFRDIEAIDPGVDCVRALEQALKPCVVMLVLIGPQWMAAQDAQGRRRLDSEADAIRVEVAEAMRRGIRVIPLLVDGVALPAAESLPADLRALGGRQALQLSDSRWRNDVQRLLETLAQVPGLRPLTVAAARSSDAPPAASAGAGSVSRPSKAGNPVWIGIAIGVLGMLGAAAYFGELGGVGEPVAPSSSAAFDQPLQRQPQPAADDRQLNAPAERTMEPRADQPVQQVPPAATAEAAAVPSLAGDWRGDNGMSYTVAQSGTQFAIVSYRNGAEVGRGQGSLSGTTLQVAMAELFEGIGIVNYQCAMQADAPDLSAFSGACRAADGTELPGRIFR